MPLSVSFLIMFGCLMGYSCVAQSNLGDSRSNSVLEVFGFSESKDLQSSNSESLVFRFATDGTVWRSDFRALNKNANSTASLYCDGTNTHSLVTYDAPDRPNTGFVYSGDVPLGSGHIQGIWAALYPQLLRRYGTTNFPQLINYEMLSPSSASAAELVVSNGLLQGFKLYSGDQLIDEFLVLGRTNIVGFDVVTEFVPWTIHYTSATKTTITTLGMVITCGGGTSALAIDPVPFEGICAWSESGSNCTGPWGPVPKTGPVNLYSCVGYCPPPA